ncbi:hypothetical protein [Candidatus Magnetaquicoccus inordinatus]|uniref:hypothetical protein n=1 Tax=Candidatus Magnetaquicoccus inordinatus TaxID=2496818 RepID=UPI00102C4B44|nr:hypothetical protein [Candidatus Magnetaquicoccus inordinatus]
MVHSIVTVAQSFFRNIRSGRFLSGELAQDRSRENARAVVQRLARGNVSLQLGWFLSEEDLQEMREKNRTHNFSANAR